MWPSAQGDINVEALRAKGLPMTDAEELLPVCFCCGGTNNLAGYQVPDSNSKFSILSDVNLKHTK